MFGTFGELFLLEAFFAGTFDKVADFEVIFKIIFFLVMAGILSLPV
jgi:hypothetical protein